MFRSRLATAALIASVLLTGCTGDPAPTGGDTPAAEPGTWAAQVCTALAPWREEIAALTSEAKEHITDESTPQDTKDTLAELFTGASAKSETARAAVEAAGVPDVEGGAEIAAGFVASLTASRDAYQTAADTVSALDPDAPDFYDDVAAAMDELNADYAAGPDLVGLNSVELQEAFATVPECA